MCGVTLSRREVRSLASLTAPTPQVLEVEDRWWRDALHARLLHHHGHEPSTGFIALGLAIALAQHAGASPPSVFGFGACVPCSKYFKCRATDQWESAEASGTEAPSYGHPYAQEKLVRRAS